MRKGKLPHSSMNAITPALQRSAFCVYPAPVSTLGQKQEKSETTNKQKQTIEPLNKLNHPPKHAKTMPTMGNVPIQCVRKKHNTEGGGLRYVRFRLFSEKAKGSRAAAPTVHDTTIPVLCYFATTVVGITEANFYARHFTRHLTRPSCGNHNSVGPPDPLALWGRGEGRTMTAAGRR